MSHATLEDSRPSVSRLHQAFLTLFAFFLLAGGITSHAAPVDPEPCYGCIPLDPGLTQEAYVKASNTDEGDLFASAELYFWQHGTTIAYTDDLLVIGAPSEESGVSGDPDDNSLGNAGAAYVYSRTGGAWQFEAYLKAPNPAIGSLFGTAVATDGTTIVVGASGGGDDYAGRVFVFRNDGLGWTLRAILAPADRNENDGFGASVAVSGGIVAVGAPGYDGPGHTVPSSGIVYLYSGGWKSPPIETTETYAFTADDTEEGDHFGGTLAFSGDLLAVAALGEDSGIAGVGGDPYDEGSQNSGAVYVFQVGAAASFASEVAFLKASNPDPGDNFGQSVAISGTTVAVGTVEEDSASTGVDSDDSDNSLIEAGAAYVFDLVGGDWQQVAYLKPNESHHMEHFGASVGVYGNTVVVGATGEDGSGTGVNPTHDDSASLAGAVYVFRRSGGTWSQVYYLKASNTDVHDEFGSALAIHGDTLVVGAHGEDSGATLINGSQGNDITTDGGRQGAAYVFRHFEDF